MQSQRDSQSQVIHQVGRQHGLDQRRAVEHQNVPACSGRVADTTPFSTEHNQRPSKAVSQPRQMSSKYSLVAGRMTCSYMPSLVVRS